MKVYYDGNGRFRIVRCVFTYDYIFFEKNIETLIMFFTVFTEYQLNGKRLTIGRAVACDICIPNGMHE